MNPRASPTVRPDTPGSFQPRQQPTLIGLKRACDYAVQRFIKCPQRCHFHSLAELYHAALLEGDTGVNYFCPQPIRLKVRGKRYIPDIYYSKDGRRYVAELKPRGEFADEMRVPLAAYFRDHQIEFVVISNEDIYGREIEAQNWLFVVRFLLTYRHLSTDAAKFDLLETLNIYGTYPIGNLIDRGNRISTINTEAAIFELLYEGKIRTDLDQTFLNYDSVIYPCT